MHVIHAFDHHTVAPVGLNIRAILIGAAGSAQLDNKLARLGASVEVVSDLFAGLEALIEDPAGYGLCVIDCDAIGGLEAARRGHALLGEVRLRVPVILISSECHSQEFPQERGVPVVLRAPASGLSMRMGFEHALRDRLMLHWS